MNDWDIHTTKKLKRGDTYKIINLVLRFNREVQHVNKSPGFTLVVGLKVAFLFFFTKNLTPLLKQPTNM